MVSSPRSGFSSERLLDCGAAMLAVVDHEVADIGMVSVPTRSAGPVPPTSDSKRTSAFTLAVRAEKM